MAIRPVDLQLAYLATPVNAAVASSAQHAPQVAQEVAQQAFADEVKRREETVAETAKTEHEARIHADADGGGNGGAQTPQHHVGKHVVPNASGDTASLGLPTDGEHFIDVVA